MGVGTGVAVEYGVAVGIGVAVGAGVGVVQECMWAKAYTLVEASLWGLAWAQASQRAPV